MMYVCLHSTDKTDEGIVLQCCDTVGWVIQPVIVSEMTCNVSCSMLKLTIPYYVTCSENSVTVNFFAI